MGTATMGNDPEHLKHELLGLFQYIHRVREEIAAISKPADSEHHFESMADQLDAIVEATEEATDVIMSAVEANDALISEIKSKVKSEEALAKLDEVLDNGNRIFEACSFQDITGQRVTKIARSLTYVETRVKNLIDLWGKEEIDSIAVQPVVEKTEDEKLLNGPQRKDEAISQAEIDKLFD
ncbi:MAG: hypothetical protein ACPGNT_10200 [Rhodospirillales bacterium]